MSRWGAWLWWPALWLLFHAEGLWAWALAPLASPGQDVLYARGSLSELGRAHGLIVAAAMFAVLALGVPLAVLATRRAGRGLLPLLTHAAAVGQTFPPVAVLFLALPVFGFGAASVVLALSVYGLMPVVQGALTGLRQVPAEVVESARGMGMGGWQRLWRIELPLALPALLAGARTSLVLLIATAALAPMVGGASLGTPIVTGLTVDNAAQVVQGAVAVALLALAADHSMRALVRAVTRWR